MYNYRLSFEAEEDIIRIFEYGLGRFGLQQAIKYYDMMFECFDKIASNPFLFPVVSNYKNAERFCVCGVDTIYYNIKKEGVEIITIIGRQDY
ncbi:type II toxin-antitoxin system RelE/ParE family toxin [Flavobacterium sp. LC2016-23]|uniref:type II toxin-antitoxin system RelE/ParE family toxin n=1 Tax=Flavobacterium sp. LC2016-23 TaxID=2666330 RepID=UPI0012B093E6|nr:type II toxin-antitoxin system RelE/ParE family toxin [Flavobacterium sp. LC2016-23]MRX40324.1 type II toxin-antitoxin system RelE/ParE family toxin [Flavobacterium sp. LC2016-23]